MKTLKIAALALSALMLSSAALAHGNGHAYGHRKHRQDYRVAVLTPRWEARYAAPRCEYTRPVGYVPVKAGCEKIVALKPGVQVKIAFGF